MQNHVKTLMVGTALTLAAYVLFYSHNSEALQIWYAANLLVPVALLLAAVGHQLLRGHARWLAPVVASAYLLQVTAEESWRTVWLSIHLVSSAVWILAFLAHLISRAGPSAQSESPR